MKFWILYVSVASALMAAGCTPPVPTREYPAAEPVTIAAPPDSVWPTVIDVITSRNLVIKTIDRSSGFLQTETMVGSSITWWDCGATKETETTSVGGTVTRTVPVMGQVFTRITIAATAVNDGTRVRVVTVPHLASLEGSPCNSKGVFETELMKQIAEQWRTNHGR